MRIFFFQKNLLVLVLLLLPFRVSAHKWWTELQSVTKSTAMPSGSSDRNNTTVNGKKRIQWSSIPRYSVVKCIETDSITGEALKNEDGTVKYRMLLVDQFGNIRSAESVAAQQAKVKQAVSFILTKVAAGSLIGIFAGMAQVDKDEMLAGALAGGAVGAGAGLIASSDDIKQARIWKKVLKQQEKLLKAYRKNYNEEGVPRDASVDPSRIRNLDFNEENTVSVRTDEIKKEVESSNFSTSDNSAFDF